MLASFSSFLFFQRSVQACLGLLVVSLTSLSCSKESTPAPAPESHKLEVPPGYDGPIDPDWPPSHAASLDEELKVSRILKRHKKNGTIPPIEGILPGDTPDVYAEEGRIGGFDYIEVILGPRKSIDEPLPLVVLLHGRGGKPTIPKGPYLTNRAIRLFIPRGPDHLKGGYNWLATWTNSGKTELLARSLAGRVDQLMPAIIAFRELRPTAGLPIIVGFSQGGILSFGLAIRHPNEFSAVFPISGWLPTELMPAHKHPNDKYPYLHVMHGADDKVVPTQKARESVERLRKFGLQVKYTEIPDTAHVVSPKMSKMVRAWVRKAYKKSENLSPEGK